MADDDPLMQRLRAGGEASGTGSFSLDPIKARAKLREFQLADPHRFVLLLVQAFAMRGATHIDVDTDADDLWVSSDAAPLAFEELSDLYLLLFSDAPPPAGLRELALGLNAAMATDPAWVRLECGSDGAPGVRLEQRNDAADQVVRLDAAPAGLRVHVHRRFSLGIVRRFFTVGRTSPETDLLRARCGFAGIAITLGGKPLPRRSVAHDVFAWHPVMLAGRNIGEVGLSPEADAGRLELVRHHVWLQRHVYDAPNRRGLRGVVDVSHLRTDASMADVVRDGDYEAVLAAVDCAVDLALAAAARHDSDGLGLFAGPLRELLLGRIAAYLTLPDADPTTEPLRDYLRVPLWFAIDGSRRNSAQVLESGARWSEVECSAPPPELADVIFARGHAAKLFAATFDPRAFDWTAQVRRAVTITANRAAFMDRLHAVILPSFGRYDVTREFQGGACHGVLGWTPNNGPSWVRIVVDNRLLVELPCPGELGTLHVVVGGRMRPTEMFDDVVRDDAFASSLHGALVALAEVVRTICVASCGPSPIPVTVAEDLLRYMIATCSASHERAWARGLGLDEARFTALCTERGRPWRLTPAQLKGDAPHPFVDLPLFADAGERPVALREIDAAIESDGFVRVITLGRPPLREPPAFVVRVGDLRANLLDALYGKAKVRRIGREYARWVVLETLRESQPEAMVIDGACALGPIELTLEGRRVLVALRTDDLQSGAKRSEARVFLDGRPVTTATLEAACSLEFVVEIEEADLDDDARGVTPQGLVRVRDTAAAGLGHALDRLLENRADLAPTLGAFVVEALALALPGPGFAAAWTALSSEHDAARCMASYVELLAIADVHAPDRVDAALLALVHADDPLTPDAVMARLGEPRRADNGWSRLRTAAAERLPQLLQAPALATAGGDALAVQAVFDAVAGAGRFGYLREDHDVPPALASVAVLRGELLLTMLGIFGDKRLRDRTDELGPARRRRAFEQRAAPTELVLPEADTLASIVIEIDGIRGVLGVPRRPPTPGPGAIRITNARRPVTTIDPMPDTAWIGILDGDGFGEEFDFAELTPREVQRVHALLVSHRPMIIAALLTAHAARPDDHTRSWLQHLLRQVLPPRGHDPAALGNAGVSAMLSVPLFVDPDGAPLTLLDLRAQFDQHRCLAIVRSAGLQLDRRLVWVRDDVEHTLLRHLFGLLKEVDEAAERRTRQASWVAAAPPLPAAPADAFVVESVDSRHVTGALWLAPGVDASTMIDLGVEGRALSKWQVSRMFPCGGAITGEGVTVNAAFDGCEVTNSRADHLASAAARLYMRLLESMRPDFGPVDDPRCVLLRDLLLRLHSIQQAKRKWPSHEMRRLYRELEDAPLLPLASGRGVSLRTAMRTMPDELAALRATNAEIDIDDAPSDSVSAPAADAPPMVPPQVGEPAHAATAEPMPGPRADAIAPPAPPPAPSPEQILRERILAELRLLHRRDMQLLRESHLDVVTVSHLGGPYIVALRDSAVIVDSGHAVVRRALAPDTDPLLVSVLASAVLTALNIAYEEFTDAEEGRLLRLHADHLRTARSAPTQD